MQSSWLRAFGSLWSTRVIKKIFLQFSRIESVLFLFLFAILLGSSMFLAVEAHHLVTHEAPAARGELHEGVLGSPRLINPALAQTGPDRDLVEVIFAGLVTYDADGAIIPELAESYAVSDDGLEYTFTLRKNLRFHDGHLLTAEDVAYTIKHIQDPLVKSPLRTTWEGVTVTTLDPLTVRFTLAQPYAGFLDAATVGIMPRHIWQGIAYEHLVFTSYNLNPIGAGPYRLTGTSRDREADAIAKMQLSAFSDYALGAPFITRLTFSFYQDINQLALDIQTGVIDSTISISGDDIAKLQSDTTSTTQALPLPRVFGLYMNDQLQPLLRDQGLRTIIAESIDRQAIVTAALNNLAMPTDQPLPEPYLTPSTNADNVPDIATLTARLDRAGWKLDETTGIRSKTTDGATTPLEFSLVTINHPTLVRVAQTIADQLGTVGIKINLRPVDASELTQTTIPRREFDILLFGQTYLHEANAFAFWHSSQRTDPGLNITNYANTRTDNLLTSIFTENDPDARKESLEKFAEIITKEHPAIFLYSPELVYVTPGNLTTNIHTIKTPEGRFTTIHTWYQYTRRILNIFS